MGQESGIATCVVAWGFSTAPAVKKEFADFRKKLLREPSRVKKCNRCVFS
jgi:hypothetical protein